MSQKEFIEGITGLGYTPQFSSENNRVYFEYKVPGGRFSGQVVQLGFEVPEQFPLTPPSGPHIAPRLHVINPSAPQHPDRIHESPFGSDWEYWSRPFPDWVVTNRTVKEYMRFIRHLWETQ